MATTRHLMLSARFYSGYVARKHCCKLLIVGGGAGGCSVAWRFARRLREHDIIVLEPSLRHYNQPVFTLVASGIKPFSATHRPTESVLPSCVGWIRDHVEQFNPCENSVRTRCGDIIKYEFLVIALGIENDYDKVADLREALNCNTCPVTTIYSPKYCQKTWLLLQKFKGGHAVFTYPHCSGKCSGAAQKIMYLADDYWRMKKFRCQTSISFVTGSKALFTIPKYETALTQIAANRGITTIFNSELVAITYKEARFRNQTGGSFGLPYNFLHVAPPMCTPACLAQCSELATERGFLDVDHHTLQHCGFANIFGLGDCLCTPNSKTAAAVSQQSYVLEQNLSAVMAGHKPRARYNGYGACPMLTSYRRGIIAEFLYGQKVCETFPFDQSKERRLFFLMKKYLLPFLYWNRLLKGKWNGPSTIRKIINPFGR